MGREQRDDHGDIYVEGRGVVLDRILEGVRAARRDWPGCPGIRVRIENNARGGFKSAKLMSMGFEVMCLERDGRDTHLLLGQANRAPLPRARVAPPVTVRVGVVLWALLRGRWCVLLQAGRDQMRLPMTEPTLHETVQVAAHRLLMRLCADRFELDGIVGMVWRPPAAGRSCQQILVRARPGWRTTAQPADLLLDPDIQWVPADELAGRTPEWASILLACREGPALRETEGPWGRLYLPGPPENPWADQGYVDADA